MAPTLAALCAGSQVAFIVSRQDLQAPPLDVPSPELPAKYRALRLYRCER